MITAKEQATINKALAILSREINAGEKLSSPEVAIQYLTVKLARAEREYFGAVWLDSQLVVLGVDELFAGTLAACQVHAREVVKAALARNAAAAILFHNHPSGNRQASAADERLTAHIKDALEVIDVRVVDHVIVAGAGVFSFAEHGLI